MQKEIFSLYRALIRSSMQFSNYNFRDHARRRIRAGFKANRNIEETEKQGKIDFGKNQLDLIKRQSLINQLYPEMQSVIN
jgi:hypothetical protein